MITLLAAFLWTSILALLGIAYWYLTIPKNLPPGPMGLPLVGSAIQYWDASKNHGILEKHIKKYGPIFKMYIANKLVVILGDYDSIQEAMVKQSDIFAGRPKLYSILPERFRRLGKSAV